MVTEGRTGAFHSPDTVKPSTTRPAPPTSTNRAIHHFFGVRRRKDAASPQALWKGTIQAPGSGRMRGLPGNHRPSPRGPGSKNWAKKRGRLPAGRFKMERL